MIRWLALLALVTFTLALTAQTKRASGQETVEQVRTEWVEHFKQDPAGKIEVFHVGGQKTIKGQENYIVGMTEAAFETGHPIYFTQGTEDITSDGTIGKPAEEKIEK